MAQQTAVSIENNFTKGLLTEFTGLNFPEHAATDADNCFFDIVGDVTNRGGLDFETNGDFTNLDRINKAISTYKWNNVGGDGITQMYVLQVGLTLHFFRSSTATAANPLSKQHLTSTIDLTPFIVADQTLDVSKTECQFSDGNGYLFVYNAGCEPFFCSYDGSIVTATLIDVKIRDFTGVLDGSLAVNTRPTTLTDEHLYNLTNQGWTQGSAWSAFSNTLNSIDTGVRNFAVAAGLPVALGDVVNIYMTQTYGPGQGTSPLTGVVCMTGNVINYTGTTLGINVTSADRHGTVQGAAFTSWAIYPVNHGYIASWKTAVGNYPSNADVWWNFKDTTNAFNPGATYNNITLNTGYAPKGHFIINAFNQQRSLISGVNTITDVKTKARPKTGTWFQGRVWYAGVDGSQVASGNAGYYTWTEEIYFSQTIINSNQFGMCYQTNDPTSEELFDLLPTDGGVVKIQGCGPVYKLFPIQNGLLVFAANGIWFITGSQGIGFKADDYTVVKLSNIQSISGTSHVNVQGLPMFWNEEGIYQVVADKTGRLDINSVTVSTIDRFYADIPLQSKKFARGDYNPIDYVVQWTYRDENETDVTSRYDFNKILNYNTHNQAFYPYTVNGTPSLLGVNYIAGIGGLNSTEPCFKYPVIVNSSFTFADEQDEEDVDWQSYLGGTSYESYFVTGYSLKGQALRKFQPSYIYIFTRSNEEESSYKIQSIWDFADDRDSNRYSSQQVVFNPESHYGMTYKRLRLRGHGLAMQIKVTSMAGMPFDIMGWTMSETINGGS